MRAVAIDGPSGAGKSTIAKAAAAKFGFMYVDTGAMYRTIGLYILRCGEDTKDPAKVIPHLSEITVDMKYVDGEQRMLLNGEDVSSLIRTEEVSMAASNVSAIPEVRQFLMELQRGMARRYVVVMDGRDIGTVILPEAQCKIFLTASPEARAQRRLAQLLEKGESADYETVLRDIETRDYNDSHREIAPLKPCEESVIVDTSDYSLEDSVSYVCGIIRGKLGTTA